MEIEKYNLEKANLIYGVIDQSEGFYQGVAEENSRSQMNITFRIRDKTLERKFLAEGEEHGLIGLAGHRSVGGIRVSTYNSISLESCKILANYMEFFQKNNR